VEVVDTAILPFETLDRLFPPGAWSSTSSAAGCRAVCDRSGARPPCPAGRYLEVRMADVKANPEFVERRVLEFLG